MLNFVQISSFEITTTNAIFVQILFNSTDESKSFSLTYVFLSAKINPHCWQLKEKGKSVVLDTRSSIFNNNFQIVWGCILM